MVIILQGQVESDGELLRIRFFRGLAVLVSLDLSCPLTKQSLAHLIIGFHVLDIIIFARLKIGNTSTGVEREDGLRGKLLKL